jgi:acetyl/propionyl-CoA carboxylase alpha subunit
LRRYIDGEEVELDPSLARVSKLPDRLMVHGPGGTYSAVAVRTGDKVQVSFKGRVYTVEASKPRARAGAAAGNGELRAPMPGQIVDVLVSEGAVVTKGQKVLVLEAMKTQQPFIAPFDGVVEKLHVSKGQQVGDGEVLAVLRASEAGV